MQMLEDLFGAFERRSHARWWAGERPEGRDGQLALIIANKLGYPASRDPFPREGLCPLTRPQAAHVLAVAGTTSLAYGRPVPRQGWLDQTRKALGEMADDAVFFGNGFWQDGTARSWTSLSAATFDCGVIGFDAVHAFIFWAEEED